MNIFSSAISLLLMRCWELIFLTRLWDDVLAYYWQEIDSILLCHNQFYSSEVWRKKFQTIMMQFLCTFVFACAKNLLTFRTKEKYLPWMSILNSSKYNTQRLCLDTLNHWSNHCGRDWNLLWGCTRRAYTITQENQLH